MLSDRCRNLNLRLIFGSIDLSGESVGVCGVEGEEEKLWWDAPVYYSG